MLGRSALHAIRALLELAEAPQRWRSVPDLAAAQQLPEALLEQLMLRLRRAGLLEARRGRQGGYRLARPAAAIPLAAILAAVAASRPGSGEVAAPAATAGSTNRQHSKAEVGLAGLGVAALGCAEAGLADGATARGANHEAASQVTAVLERRLQQALERELARFTLEELHHDLRSARAALSADGGLLLG